MNAVELVRILRQQPFEPIEIEFVGGHREVVKHPDNCHVSGSKIAIGKYEHEGEVADWTKTYSIRHLVSVEPVNKQSA